MDSRPTSRLGRATFAFALSLTALCAFAGLAQAASPAWKLLAVTGPTNLPPKQSEVQRIAVEAEGGSFAFEYEGGEGQLTPVVKTGNLTLTEGSDVATIESVESGAEFGVGDRITPPGAYLFGEEITIVSCSTDCKTPGSTVTLSNPAAATEANAPFEIFTKEATVVSGDFNVGDGVQGAIFQYFPPGAVVTAVGAGTITLSKPTGFEYLYSEGTIGVTITGRSAAAYNASPAALQSAIEVALGAGTVSVSGGPGGDAEHPYFVEFTGPLAEQDVEALSADGSELVGEHAAVHVFTTIPGGPGTGEIAIDPANIGGADTSGEYTVTFGPLPVGIVTSGAAHGEDWTCPGGAGESVVTCTSSESVPRHKPSKNIIVPVEVEPSVASTGSAQVTISGGEAGSDSIELPIVVSKQDALPGAAAFWAGAFDEDGNPEVQAGGHPHSAISYFMLNTVRAKNGKIAPVGEPKNVIVDLPPGFGGNPLVMPRCPQSQVTIPNHDAPLCNQEMTIGVLMPALAVFGQASPGFAVRVFNDVPPQGYAAEFTTIIGGPLQSLLASVRSSDDYGVRITAPNNPNYTKIYGAFTALEGFPPGAKGKAFMFNPSDCAEEAKRPPVVRTKSETWQEPGVFSVTADQVLPPVTGCEKLEFHPDFSFQPTSTSGSSGVGATAHLHIDQDGLSDPGELRSPDLKKSVVSLPEGLTLNASSAHGLEACSESEIGLITTEGALPNPIRFNEDPPACPDGSKLGTAEVRTPLLDNPLTGTVFLAAQDENPFGALLALYLVIDDAQSGVRVKLPGKIDVAPGGQLTATFDHNPQLPFEDLTLHFRGGGPHSELATPEVCGRYETKGSWTPWSAPESGPPAQTSDSFTVAGNCAASAATRPFGPSFEAGTTNPLAGGYSPLVIKIGRADGEQELSRLAFKMPPGFSGRLAGIPYCSEGGIAAAQAKSGKAEQAAPSCAPASRLGSISATAGVGPDPFRVGGSLYLSGPYKGAPLSAVAITPALAGPFDLGNVVIRAPLNIDPETAQVSTVSDPIPTALQNIPLKVREVAVNLDRPSFTLNLTSCEAMQISASIASSDGALATPHNRFQVGGCRELSFEPKTYLRLYGGTGRGAHPKLRAIYMTKPGEANLAKGSFTLPRSEFLDQAHIRTICTRVQFAAGACPKGAIYGHVKAFSPIVDYPVSGPVYLRSSDNELPDLVFDLHGPAYQPVHVAVVLRIDSVRGQIRATAENAPDLPVSKLIFFQQGGKKGLLVNSRNICKRRYRATVKTEGHNGKRSTFKPVLSNSKCGKGRKATRKNKRHQRRHNG